MINKTTFTNLTSIVANFNIYFTEIGPNLAKQVNQPIKAFNEYSDTYDTIRPVHVVSINELKDPFFSLNLNKSPGYDDISLNVIRECFGNLHKLLLYIFCTLYFLYFILYFFLFSILSMQTVLFHDELKIVRITV